MKSAEELIKSKESEIKELNQKLSAKEEYFDDFIKKQKVENQRARNLLTKVFSGNSEIIEPIESNVEVIPKTLETDIKSVQLDALSDSYKNLLKRAYFLLERSRNI